MEYSETHIIEGCRSNDRKSQEALYRKYFASMMSMCMRYTKDEDTAIMIVNDGFLKVFKNIGKYSATGSLGGWIRRLVFNCLSDYFRKENKHLKFLILEEKEPKVRRVSTVYDDLFFEDIIKLLDYLPENTRLVFKMYAIEGYSHKEVGERLNISAGTSKWHLSEARKKLKILLEAQQKLRNHAG